jgi:hypothetical protein
MSPKMRFHVPEETALALEDWVNYGNGKTASYDLEEYLYLLLSGDYLGAARLLSPDELVAFGFILAELSENAPRGSFGSLDAVKTWQGLAGDEGRNRPGNLVVES